MRSLPIVLAILAVMFYLGGPPLLASQDGVVAILASPGVLALAAVVLGVFEWLSEPERPVAQVPSQPAVPPTLPVPAPVPASE